MQPVKRPQNRGGIAAAAAKTSSYRNIFLKGNVCALGKSGLRKKRIRCPEGQIPLVLRKIRPGAAQRNFPPLPPHLQHITEGKFLHETFYLMIPVRSFAEHLEIDIDLCRGLDGQCIVDLERQHVGDWVGIVRRYAAALACTKRSRRS